MGVEKHKTLKQTTLLKEPNIWREIWRKTSMESKQNQINLNKVYLQENELKLRNLQVSVGNQLLFLLVEIAFVT